nr:putative transposase En/Spm [Ipomoea batatas]
MIEIIRHLEDTDSERSTLASRESEHTTKAATKHTSQPASKPSTPPSTIPNDRRTLIHPTDEKGFEPLIQRIVRSSNAYKRHICRKL